MRGRREDWRAEELVGCLYSLLLKEKVLVVAPVTEKSKRTEKRMTIYASQGPDPTGELSPSTLLPCIRSQTPPLPMQEVRECPLQHPTPSQLLHVVPQMPLRKSLE